MKTYKATTKEEYFSAIREILDGSEQAILVTEGLENTHESFIPIEDSKGSGIKGILYACWNGNLDEYYMTTGFELVGFYCEGKFINIRLGKMSCFSYFNAMQHGVDEFAGMMSWTSDVRDNQLPAKIWAILSIKYPDLNALKEAGYAKWVELAKKYHWAPMKLLQRDIIRNAVLKGEDAFKSWPKPTTQSLIMVLAGKMSLDDLASETIDRHKDDDGEENPYYLLAKYYSYSQAVKKAEAAMTDSQKQLAEMLNDLGKQVDKGSRITIRLRGRDGMLDKKVLKEYPDYSIDGQEIVISTPFFPRQEELQTDCSFAMGSFSKLVEPKLAKKNSKGNWKYIDNYDFGDILSITYRGKMLYKKAVS